MKQHLIFALLAAFVLAGCNDKKDETTAPAESASAGNAASDAELMKAAEEAARNAADPNAAPAEDATAATAVADPTLAPAAETGAIPGLILGKDYELVKNGQPFEPLNGKIEVVEMFNFVCPACANFQPLVVGWKKNLPPDVRFTYVPAAFGGNWDPYVRAFYAAQTMGVAERAHDKLYDAIHLEGKLKGERGSDSDAEIAAVYAQYGVDAKQFAANMKSFAVTGKFNKAKQYFIDQSIGVGPSTPTLFVNGKYRVIGTFDDRFRVVDALIAYERAQASAPAKP